MIPLSAAPSGLSIFFYPIPRAARTYSPLTLGYVLTAPSEPSPRWGFEAVIDLGYALPIPSEPFPRWGFEAVIDFGYDLTAPSEPLPLRGFVMVLFLTLGYDLTAPSEPLPFQGCSGFSSIDKGMEQGYDKAPKGQRP